MSTLFQKSISYIPVTGSYVDGVWTKVEGATTIFQGSVQPLSGKDLDSLEISREDKGLVKVYSSSKLNVSQAETNKSGDIIIWDSRKWEIITELTYSNNLIEHWKYLAEFREAV